MTFLELPWIPAIPSIPFLQCLWGSLGPYGDHRNESLQVCLGFFLGKRNTGNIGNILGTFQSDNSHYIVLELVEGLPLFDWIVEHGIFFRESTASAALKQLCALGAAGVLVL